MFSVKKAALAAAASVAALALGACSAHPGTALVVNGVSYSEADVTRAANELRAFTGEEVGRPAVVHALPGVLAYNEAAESAGIVITDADVDALVADLAARNRIVVPEGGFGAVTKDLLRPNILGGRLNTLAPETAAKIQADYTRIIAENEIEMNPRYGTLDPEGNPLLPVFADVIPAAQIAAAPTGQ